MKKIIFIIFLIINLQNIIAQDLVTVKHSNYTTTFSKSLHYPIVVEWWETKKMSLCANKLIRNNTFSKDPKMPNYTNLNNSYLIGNRINASNHISTLDRGHMCPSAVNLCQGKNIAKECFYFSNIAPQYHNLNAGDWEKLESITRKMSISKDSIHIWAGSVGNSGKLGIITIPKQCWKVIYVAKTKEYSAYLFNNDTSPANGIADNKVDISIIEKLTGLKFK